MKKRNLKAAIAILLASSACLYGCGNTTTSSGDKTKESSVASQSAASEASEKKEDKTEEKTEAQTELEAKTIQLWLMGPGKQKDSDKVWEAFNKKLCETVPNTTVEFTIFAGAEYKDKFNQMLASQEPVDLAWCGYTISNVDKVAYVEDGDIMPLNDLLQKYGQDVIKGNGENVIESGKFPDGESYYIISWQGLARGRNGIQIPTELANLAGEDWIKEMNDIAKQMIPSDSLEIRQKFYDKFAEYPKACLEAGRFYGGLGVYDTGTFSYDPSLITGGRYFSPAGSAGVMYGDDTFTVIDLNKSEFRKLYYKNMADYYKKGYFRSDVASIEQEEWNADGSWSENSPLSHNHNAYGENAAAEYSGRYGRDISLIRLHDTFEMGNGWETCMAIPYCADEPERAMMVLNELYKNAELYQLLIYGFPGQHYTDNGDGTITTPYGKQGNAECDYGLIKWTIGTCRNSLVTQADTKGYYEEMASYDKGAYFSPFLQFVFDRSNVEDIVTSLSAIDKEYSPMLSYGVKGDQWEETYDKWMKEREAAGMPKLLEEVQKQVNEYVKERNITSWNYTAR